MWHWLVGKKVTATHISKSPFSVFCSQVREVNTWARSSSAMSVGLWFRLPFPPVLDVPLVDRVVLFCSSLSQACRVGSVGYPAKAV